MQSIEKIQSELSKNLLSSPKLQQVINILERLKQNTSFWNNVASPKSEKKFP